jgi:hypothetical protein
MWWYFPRCGLEKGDMAVWVVKAAKLREVDIKPRHKEFIAFSESVYERPHDSLTRNSRTSEPGWS